MLAKSCSTNLGWFENFFEDWDVDHLSTGDSDFATIHQMPGHRHSTVVARAAHAAAKHKVLTASRAAHVAVPAGQRRWAMS